MLRITFLARVRSYRHNGKVGSQEEWVKSTGATVSDTVVTATQAEVLVKFKLLFLA